MIVDALLPLVERARHVGDDVVHERADVAVDDIERLLAGVEPREPQQILDEPLHALGMARDDRQEPPALLGVAVALGQRLDIAADRRQRRAQLVRDVGDEIAADLIRAAQVGDVVQDHDGAVGGIAAGGAPRGQ